MTINELERKLIEFNEDEQFYKQYYDVKNNKWQLEKFLSTLDFNQVFQRRLIVPEVPNGHMPTDMKDETYFEMDHKISIVISKHNRYTPAFRHKHIFFELIYVLTGSCTQKIEQEEIKVSEGDFCLIAPDTRHTISVYDPSVIINILIRRDTFEDIFFDMLRDTNRIAVFFNQNLYSGKRNHYLILQTNRDLSIKNHVLNMFIESINKKRYYEKILNSSLMILFAKILQDYEETIVLPKQVSKKHTRSMEILGYIEEHYQQITIKEVAEQFHYSVPHCSKRIKEDTGKSFTEIVQSIKFKKAESLLENTNISIAEVSSIIGFENKEHFNRIFKKYYNMTPGQYRRSSANVF